MTAHFTQAQEKPFPAWMARGQFYGTHINEVHMLIREGAGKTVRQKEVLEKCRVYEELRWRHTALAEAQLAQILAAHPHLIKVVTSGYIRATEKENKMGRHELAMAHCNQVVIEGGAAPKIMRTSIQLGVADNLVAKLGIGNELIAEHKQTKRLTAKKRTALIGHELAINSIFQKVTTFDLPAEPIGWDIAQPYKLIFHPDLSLSVHEISTLLLIEVKNDDSIQTEIKKAFFQFRRRHGKEVAGGFDLVIKCLYLPHKSVSPAIFADFFNKFKVITITGDDMAIMDEKSLYENSKKLINHPLSSFV